MADLPMKTCSDAARAAIAFLQRGWTAVEPAADAAGDVVPCWHPNATAWTTNGAVAAAIGVVGDDAVKKLYGRFRQMNGDHPIRVNRSQEDSILRLRACIEDGSS